MPYYDGTKLLSLMDKNGKKPEIYICTTNRSAGKTTFFSRYFVKRFMEYGEKFVLLYRFSYELDEVATKFFKDIETLFFNGHTMSSVKKARGVYHELYFDKKPCGYAFALNQADSIKKLSHLFSDAFRIMIDEFQSETNRYCDNEVAKLQSIHTSIARGQGKQSRYVPVFLIGNPVSLINPYYVSLGISNILTKNVKFLRGDGFVLEQGFNESAMNAQNESAFNRAFSDNSSYNAYLKEGVYLNDNLSFIEKPEGRSEYVATIKCNGSNYAIRRYSEQGIMYCDDSVDNSFPVKISVTTADHEVNYVMLKYNQGIVLTLRYLFSRGCFRFKNLQCKEAVLKLVSY